MFPAFFVCMLRRFAWIPLVLGVCVLTAAACGGGATPSGAKEPGSYDQDREPGSIDEAKQRFDNARAQLESTPPSHVEAGQAPVDRHGTQPVSPTGAGGAGGGSEPPQHVQETECTRLCRAFASMQRAQVALCRMAGDEDPRCAEAKKVVEDSAQRVAHCGCRG